MEWVREARRGEIQGFSDRKVYIVRSRSECVGKGIKPIGVRWVDSRKNDAVRSRLVAMDFNRNKGKKDDEMFAPTPSLLASRWIVSRTASQNWRGQGEMRLMAIDFTKAFLYGNMEREVYIELPEEDQRKHEGDMVGFLLKAMYGLRDAPLIWQKVVREMLEKRGFEALVSAQCVYVNKRTGVIVVAHVDDFLCQGDKREMEKFLEDLKKEYECGGVMLGPEEECSKEIKFLGRTIRWTQKVIEWEGDPKHVENYLTKIGLQQGKAVETPGIKHEDKEMVEPVAMSDKEATEYRGLVALLNFMAQDRADLAFASKEASKSMSAPKKEDMVALKRVG